MDKSQISCSRNLIFDGNKELCVTQAGSVSVRVVVPFFSKKILYKTCIFILYLTWA